MLLDPGRSWNHDVGECLPRQRTAANFIERPIQADIVGAQLEGSGIPGAEQSEKLGGDLVKGLRLGARVAWRAPCEPEDRDHQPEHRSACRYFPANQKNGPLSSAMRRAAASNVAPVWSSAQ